MPVPNYLEYLRDQAQVSFANPNHDPENGRFAEKNGKSGVKDWHKDNSKTNERYSGDYKMEYISPEMGNGLHKIVATYGDKIVGQMSWSSKQIEGLDIQNEHQRKGLATAMWNWGQEMRPRPKHSNDRTDQGDAWAKAIGGPIPRRLETPKFEYAAEQITASVETGPIAAGLAVVALDTNRVLMLQRALTPDDPASGKWEFPGGTIDPGEEPLTAALREWCEETGHKSPPGRLVSSWLSPNNVYQGFVWATQSESNIEINLDHEDRHVLNPDDPDGDNIETIAWWNIEDLPGNQSLRSEALDTDWNALRNAFTIQASSKTELSARVETTLSNYHEFYNKCHDEKTGHFCEEHRGGITRKVKIEKATPAEKKAARTKALAKIRIAPIPTQEDVVKAREELRRAAEEGKRAGGESRGGSAAARKQQRFNLFREFGGVTRGYVVDHQSGIKLHYTDDPKLNPNQYPILERGKIFLKSQGGGYQLNNLIPESFPTNRSRGNRPVRKENL